MARPNWEYIRVDVLLPQHPKLDGLSSASKWTLIELWAHCGQMLTDGFVREAAWKRIGSASTRRQIVEAGLAERADGGYLMHDYLEHQRSRAEVEELRAKRSAAGRRSGQARARARTLAEHPVEHRVEQTANKTRTEAEAEAEAEAEPPVAEVINGSVEGIPPLAVKLPTGKWMADDEPEPLPPERLKLEAERQRQIDALAEWERNHPEAAIQ